MCTKRSYKAEVVHLTPGLLRLDVLFNFHALLRNMINLRINADWSTTKPFAQFSCKTCVQEVHIKVEVVHLTPGLLGLGVFFNCHAY